MNMCCIFFSVCRGSTREKALASIIEAFNSCLQHEFVEKKYTPFVSIVLLCTVLLWFLIDEYSASWHVVPVFHLITKIGYVLGTSFLYILFLLISFFIFFGLGMGGGLFGVQVRTVFKQIFLQQRSTRSILI